MSSYPIMHHHGGYCLGDCWTLVNYLLCKSEEMREPVILSRDFPPKPESRDVAFNLMDRIAPMLESTGSFRWTDEPGVMTTEQPRIWSPPGGFRRLPLKPHLRWDGGSSGRIALQLDGRSGRAWKNPSPEDAILFHSLPGTIPLGLPMTLEESIAIMRTCRFMIGVCSGMSHVAHAVGIPLIIVEYGQTIREWHPAPDDPHSPWHYAKGTDQALAIAADLMKATPCRT